MTGAGASGHGSAKAGGKDAKSKEPRYSKFTQQEMWAARPIPTPFSVITAFMVIAVVFVPLGAACLAASRSTVEYSARYDDSCMPGDGNAAREAALMTLAGEGNQCDAVTFDITEKMEAPVYLYYELDNYHQNHRRYVTSRSDPQLRGGDVKSTLDACEPRRYRIGSAESEANAVTPCGLIAWSLFNDTFSVFTDADRTQEIAVSADGIAWPTDVQNRFGGDVFPVNFNQDPPTRGGGTLDPAVALADQERLAVWMRVATLPRFRKLWGRIDQDIPAGTTLHLRIQNRYNTYRFDGKKAIVLATASWLGGKNDFLGVSLLVVGCCSLLFAVVYFAVAMVHPRKAGDLAYLSWNREREAAARAHMGNPEAPLVGSASGTMH
ncbi:unnamed protein product [Pedinophyceae sp. YPF-701]|nr:unnamed protein product [Pedinophyceae sp. YPF-701]